MCKQNNKINMSNAGVAVCTIKNEKAAKMHNRDDLNSNFIWNTLAGVVNAAEAVILLMVAGRTSGLEDAGILTIAFAIGNLLATIGRYGVRNYQVTDIDNTASFSTYFSHRILTVLIMGISTAGYMGICRIIKGYSWYKICVIVLICMIYMAEAFEDVFWGLYQKNGRLDLGAKIFLGRWLLHLSIISALLTVTQRLVFSLLVGLVAGAFFSFVLNMKKFRHFYDGTIFAIAGVAGLFKNCFPLFLTAFLTNYVANAPKYAIDRYMTESVQACYGYVAMPVFVIQLLNSFLYQPILVEIASDWNEGRIEKFCNRLYHQLVVIALLTLACMAGGYFLGIPVLSLMYHTDLASYKMELLILLFGGGLLAVSGFWCVIMTVMRIQRWTMYGYIVAALLTILFSGNFVRVFGVRGAAWLYVFLMLFLMIFFTICVYYQIYQKKKTM